MGRLDNLASKTLKEHKLPDQFSYRQAFILGYNVRRLEIAKLIGLESYIDLLDNDPKDKIDA